VIAAVQKSAGDKVDGYKLAADSDVEHPDLWHVSKDLGMIFEVGGPVWIVHAPTGRVFELSGSVPPDIRIAEVLNKLREEAADT
jgi:hypothetical protein